MKKGTKRPPKQQKTDTATTTRRNKRQTTAATAAAAAVRNTRSELKKVEDQQHSELCDYAAVAQVIEFDSLGRVARHPKFKASDAYHLIDGLVKVKLPPDVFETLQQVHEHIYSQFGYFKMVPWAGVGQDLRRLRAFGFFSQSSRDRIDQLGIKLHDFDKVAEAAKEDENANKTASMVLKGNMKEKAKMAAIEVIELLRKALPAQKDVLSLDELVAMQPNLHNGAAYLKAHLDYPRHEGFGKIISTVAIEQSATIVLLGAFDRQKGEHSAWRFRLNEGECYALSGSARTMCLHGVIVEDDIHGNPGNDRHSLNLRFGLHSVEDVRAETWWENIKVL